MFFPAFPETQRKQSYACIRNTFISLCKKQAHAKCPDQVNLEYHLLIFVAAIFPQGFTLKQQVGLLQRRPLEPEVRVP